MAPLSLKIILDEGAVTRTVALQTGTRVAEALAIIKDKLPTPDDGKAYGLFLPSADDSKSGVWLESSRALDYYMLRDGDSVHYLTKERTLRVKLLDGTVKTMRVDETKNISDLMPGICEKIGLTNHDEYGLCHEDMEVVEEKKEEKPSTGTLTLKRLRLQKEKDAKIQQLSKKLKTDDNVEWLDQHKTLREIGVNTQDTLLLKRRLFFSDRNVDSRDPLQLNLLYVQTRNAILESRHPVTEAKALEFAAIQCQVQYGDFQEDKHKPGLIENLSEYLPAEYAGAWGAEKKILKLHRNYVGMAPLDAKQLYIKTARDMPTYGVTFFVVKEKQKGKKKLVPRLLGINSESVLRLDEQTKEILQAWPLTQVRSYHVGQSDNFTLNFGDYSEKEYSVKTNDAYRIRDILEGYIDIIRKRLATARAADVRESGAVCCDDVTLSRANVISYGSHGPSTVVEQSFVGPTRLVAYEQGQQAQPQGAQIMTVQQLVITNKGTNMQQARTGEVPLRSDMPIEFVRKLNKMNSNAVKVVTLLSDPTPANIAEAKKIIDLMEELRPDVVTGVQEAAEKQTTEAARKKLLDELEELQRYLDSLFEEAKKDDFNPEAAQDSARSIADLTTQMYFSLEKVSKRNSKLCSLSRQSFVEDEETQAKLRRASLIVATTKAGVAFDEAKHILAQDYNGPALTEEQVKELEASVVDKIGKMNAAIAQYMLARSDPDHIDFSAAVIAINMINETVPELAKDIQSLRAADKSLDNELLQQIQALCDAARNICVTGADDHEKVRESGNDYAEAAGKLIYMVGKRSRKLNADKENEIIDRARDVGDAMTALLIKANELTTLAEQTDPEGCSKLDAAGVTCADAAKTLLSTAQLTAPTIFEPHCGSALSASSQNLGASAQHLAVAWKPLVTSRPDLAEDLRLRTLELAKALDRLNAAAAVVEDENVFDDDQPPNRLRFVRGVAAVKDCVKKADEELDKAPAGPIPDADQARKLERSISQRIAHANAAVASIIQARADPNNPDYESLDLAMASLSELVPEIIKDTVTLSSSCADEASRRAILDDMRAWARDIDAVCASASSDNPQDLEQAALAFGNTSQKLSFVFSPRAASARERLMSQLANMAHERALQMAADSSKMADMVGGASGARLAQQGKGLAERSGVMKTTVTLTAPTLAEPRCQSAILTSVDAVSCAASALVSETGSLQDDETGCRVLAEKVDLMRSRVDEAGRGLQEDLDKIRGQCMMAADAETRRLKFIKSASAIQDKISAAEELLNHPVEKTGTAISEEEAKAIQNQIAEEISKINAAVAQLIQARSDPLSSDYNGADQAVASITETLPNIVKDAKLLTDKYEGPEREAMLKDISEWCRAIQLVCASAANGESIVDIDGPAQEYAKVSNKLSYVFNPRKRPTKEQKILQLTESACDKARQMAAAAQETGVKVGGPGETRLREGGNGLSAAATALRTSAQLSAPTILEPHSRDVLLQSAGRVSSSAQDLVSTAQRLPHPQCQTLSEDLVKYQAELDKALEGIKECCDAKVKPPVPTRKTPQVAPPKPPVAAKPVVKATNNVTHGMKISDDFLHHMRSDASLHINDLQQERAALKMEEEAQRMLEEERLKQLEKERKRQIEEEQRLAKKAEEERQKQVEFAQNVEQADKLILATENELQRLYSSPSSLPELGVQKREALLKQTEDRLAQAGTAAARLVCNNQSEALNYVAASASTRELSSLLEQIVKDAALLTNHTGDKSRKLLLDHIAALCRATRGLCAAAGGDRQKLNQHAVEFGDCTAQLLYIVATDVDPSQEKEVILRAKAIGDISSKLCQEGATVALQAGDKAADICAAGRLCADAAGGLVYTAKLVAPAVHHPDCRTSLIAASNDLSKQLKTFSASWKPLSSDPEVAAKVSELTNEAKMLEKLLEEFRQDLYEDRLVKKREELVVEDTGLRRLAVKVMEDAKEISDFSPDKDRKLYSAYAKRLAEAIRQLDIANTRCKKAPHDVCYRRALDSAVQQLQVSLLQTSPALAGKQTANIIDLTEFVKAVSAEAEKLMETANKTRPTPALESIKQECQNIHVNADRLINPVDRAEDNDPLSDILEVDYFGEDCDARVQKLGALVQGVADSSTQGILRPKFVALKEACNLLRFATKSALATAKSAEFDEALEDLDELEKRVDKLLAPVEGTGASGKGQKGLSTQVVSSRAGLVSAAAQLPRQASLLAPALVRHVMATRATADLRDEEQRNKLKKHIQDLIDTLRLMTMASSSRSSMWEPADAADLTQDLVTKLNSYPECSESARVLTDADINKLLTPLEDVQIAGDQKQIDGKLQQTATKLSTLTGTLLLGAGSPPARARSAHTVADVAAQLAYTARALRTHDPVQNKRIEEATEEMRLATYNLLTAAEAVSQEPDNDAYKRRLLDACRLLNNAINRLCRRTSAAPKLSQCCHESVRRAQGCSQGLQSARPATREGYKDCVEAVATQGEVVAKLRSEEPLSRAQVATSVEYLTEAVCSSAEYAAQCGYLLRVSEQHKEACTEGVADVLRLLRLTAEVQESCCGILRSTDFELAREEDAKLTSLVEELKVAVNEAAARVKGDAKTELVEAGARVEAAAKSLKEVVREGQSTEKLSSSTMALLDAAGAVAVVAERPGLVPQVAEVTPETAAIVDDVMKHATTLLNKTQGLMKEVNTSDDDPMTWVMFNDSRNKVLDAFDALVRSLKTNGQKAGILEPEEVDEDIDTPKKNFIQMQVDIAKKWLLKSPKKPEVAAEGEKAARYVIEIGEQLSEELSPQDKEEMCLLTKECRALLEDCAKKYDPEKAALLAEQLREVCRAIERGVATCVVDDFVAADQPLQDLEIIDLENDEVKRQYLLEKKIAELLAQLARVKRTTGFVADASVSSPAVKQELRKISQQMDLLAPQLVSAAQARVSRPSDQAAVENFRAVLQQYAEAMARVRDTCDRALDPMDFVQTAGESMQRMREESSKHNDPQKCLYTSTAIHNLANRVILVGLSSPHLHQDPDLRRELTAAQLRLRTALPAPGTRASRRPDWRDTTAEILRATGQVESALGGETIFQKQPEPDKPIFAAAAGLHAAVAGWSARDNEVVALAKRMAVSMARLSEYMHADKKRELLSTSKRIVAESHEVCRIARKLAMECTDLRIRQNLLQVCERIPTISGQLKMLTTVKGSSLGHQGRKEDEEAMNMLVGNAQNLMLSVKEVVKAAEGATVKIASQRGRRMRWVQRTY